MYQPSDWFILVTCTKSNSLFGYIHIAISPRTAFSYSPFNLLPSHASVFRGLGESYLLSEKETRAVMRLLGKWPVIYPQVLIYLLCLTHFQT